MRSVLRALDTLAHLKAIAAPAALRQGPEHTPLDCQFSVNFDYVKLNAKWRGQAGLPGRPPALP
jgi:hypothetical protein